MSYNLEAHHRRSIRLRGYDYAQNGAYFVTLCTHERECLFGDVEDGQMRLTAIGEIVEACWLRIAEVHANVILDEFVVMPNHLHGILVLVGSLDTHPVGARQCLAPTITNPSAALPRLKPGSLGAIVGAFKSVTAKRINVLRNTPGMPIWQRNYYEHIIRGEEDLDNIRFYIAVNPGRWDEDENNPHHP